MGREPGDSPEEPARLNGPSVSAVPYALFDRAALWCGPLGLAPRYSLGRGPGARGRDIDSLLTSPFVEKERRRLGSLKCARAAATARG